MTAHAHLEEHKTLDAKAPFLMIRLISFASDPDMLADTERMKKPLERTKAKIVGSTAVRLEGDPIQCRLRECNSGTFLCRVS